MLINYVVILPHFIMIVFDLVVDVFNFGHKTTTKIMKRKLFELNDLTMPVDLPFKDGIIISLQQVKQGAM